MEEVAVGPRILINPPPRDCRCEKCGRPFMSLPVFAGIKEEDLKMGGMVHDQTNKVRLMKTFRGHQCVGASWECADCIQTPDVSDLVVDTFGDDDPFAQERKTLRRRLFERIKYKQYMVSLEIRCRMAVRKGEKQFKWDGMLMPVAYWSRHFGIGEKSHV